MKTHVPCAQNIKNDSAIRSRGFLGKSRTAFKFSNSSMQKYLSTSNFQAIALDDSNAAKK